MSRGGGDFGFLEVCGDVIPSSLQSQLDSGEIIPHPPTIPLTTITAGTVEVVMRTSDMGRFPGFSAAVVCVSTKLLRILDGGTTSSTASIIVGEAKSLASSVDEVNIPFDAGITYIDRVVSIVDMDMKVIRRYKYMLTCEGSVFIV